MPASKLTGVYFSGRVSSFLPRNMIGLLLDHGDTNGVEPHRRLMKCTMVLQFWRGQIRAICRIETATAPDGAASGGGGNTLAQPCTFFARPLAVPAMFIRCSDWGWPCAIEDTM